MTSRKRKTARRSQKPAAAVAILDAQSCATCGGARSEHDAAFPNEPSIVDPACKAFAPRTA